jgi:pantoate--beta-alanine ligase
MEILASPATMRAWRREFMGTVGLVPTMGYLHEGHLSLVRQSVQDNDATVASIFVNPTQFGPNEDFERYPRDEERDLAMLEEAGVAAVYMPTVDQVYPEGYETYVTPGATAERLEGGSRPGHFRGVTTVVLKLINATGADRAYFGRKDAQQLRVIRRMVIDLDLGIEVVACPIVREADGLAMSSRNVYLSAEDRAASVVLSAALRTADAAYRDGERNAESLRQVVRGMVNGEPRATLDYVSLADDVTLDEIEGRVERPALLSLAAKFGATRLIDNLELG